MDGESLEGIQVVRRVSCGRMWAQFGRSLDSMDWKLWQRSAALVRSDGEVRLDADDASEASNETLMSKRV